MSVLFYLLGACLLLVSAGFGGSAEPPPAAPATGGEAAEPKRGPLDPTGLDKEVAHILQRHYAATWSNADTWAWAQSLRVRGTLEMPSGMVDFVAFKRKPNRLKIELRGPTRNDLVMGFDGERTWQYASAIDAAPKPMAPAEAANFRRDAVFSGHLVHPHLPGKTIKLLGTERVEGRLCYRLQVRLPSDQTIDYWVDVTDFLERRTETRNRASDKLETVTHLAYREVDGIQIPVESRMETDGEWIHTVRVDRAAFNRGTTAWMFRPESVTADPDSASANGRLELPPVEGPAGFGGSAFNANPRFPDPEPLEPTLEGLTPTQ